MQIRQLGSSGLAVSVVGLGTNQFRTKMDDAAVNHTVSAALDAGITLFDTADIYGGRGGSEESLGLALRGRRDRAVVATKFGMDMGDGAVARGSRRYIRLAVEASLRRLQTDWIDLYQYHEPDGVTPIAETLAALDELVDEGKVRYIGSSNLAAWQVADAEWIARGAHGERFISAQNRYSLLEREVERELAPAAVHFGIGILPFFPLAAGVLTGKYRRGEAPPPGTRLAGQPHRAHEMLTETTFALLDRLEAFGRERGHTLLEVAIAGLASRSAVSSVISGATSPEQVRANAAAGDWALGAEDRAALDALLHG
ncbi:MAG TPA: aldo/keto reductase [Candidatus Angelobacter sp.]|jgi:aryl-alcohol dehydrogenase-like predicted oxidoreductase|nr:aldo/keto reductase [Candidatus Angelobacter sp.]